MPYQFLSDSKMLDSVGTMLPYYSQPRFFRGIRRDLATIFMFSLQELDTLNVYKRVTYRYYLNLNMFKVLN